jgi:hypothetical protein
MLMAAWPQVRISAANSHNSIDSAMCFRGEINMQGINVCGACSLGGHCRFG